MLKKKLCIFLAFVMMAGIVFSINTTVVSAIAPPAIFHTTEAVAAGGVVGCYGSDFTTSGTTLAIKKVIGNEPSLSPSQVDATFSPEVAKTTHVLARIPSTVTQGMYALWVNNGSGWSQIQYINRTTPRFITHKEIYPGQVVRLYGTNLKQPGVTPVVRFLNISNRSLAATATVDTANSDEYQLIFTVPNVTVDTNYIIQVNNGWGGQYGDMDLPEQPKVVAKNDPLNIGAAWMRYFNWTEYNVMNYNAQGNGTTDDTNAIKNTINAASNAGGGVVYLPSGTYKITSTLSLPEKVIMKGAGSSVTTITANGVDNAVTSNAYQTGGVGIANIKITGANKNSVFFSDVNGDRKFAYNVYTDNVIHINGRDELLAAYNNINKQNLNFDGPLSLCNYGDSSGSYINVFNNYTFNKIRVAMGVGGIDHIAIYNNTLQGAHITKAQVKEYLGTDTPVEHRGIEYGGNMVAIMNNNISSFGSVDDNDGEGITNQSSLAMDYGNVSSAAASSISDSTKSWSADFSKLFSRNNPYQVMIVAGKGMGQWRNISSNTANTLNVDRAWEIIPDTTSRYVIVKVFTDNIITNNTMSDTKKWIAPYLCGQIGWVVAKNTVTSIAGKGGCDSNQFEMNPGVGSLVWISKKGGNGLPTKFNPGWYNRITGNNSDGRIGISIGVGFDNASDAWGPAVSYGDEIRNNDGLWLADFGVTTYRNGNSDNYSKGSYLRFNVDAPLAVGTIFEGNKAGKMIMNSCNSDGIVNKAGQDLVIQTDSANNMLIVDGTNVILQNPPNYGTNLAQGKTTTASTNFAPPAPDDQWCGNSSYAVDGAQSTRWASVTGSNPQWIYIDLGAIKSINRVKLYWSGVATAYKVQVSNNASTWTDVYSTTMGTGCITDLGIAPVDAKFVRVYATQAGGADMSYSIWEICVYNDASSLRSQGKTASASSYSWDCTPAKANDGNPATFWHSSLNGVDNPLWWQVDLGSAFNIKGFELDFLSDTTYAGERRNFKVEGSNDVNFASGVVLLAKQGSGIQGGNSWNMPSNDMANTYRYIRVTKTVREAGDAYGNIYWAFRELRVYGSAAPTNLVLNPGFETGTLSSWSTIMSGVSVVNSNAHSGTYAVKCTGNANGCYQTITGLIPNTSYTLTGYGKLGGTGEAAHFYVQNYGGTEIGSSITGTSYAQKTITFTTGSSNTSATVGFYKEGGSGSAYADDFVLIH